MASDDASVSSTVHSYISLQDEYGISYTSDDEGFEVDASPHHDDDDDDDDDNHDHEHEHAALKRHHPYNSSLSRLSVCTTNSSTHELVDHDDGNSDDHESPHDMMTMINSQFKSGLSLGNLDIGRDEDADEEFSDVKDSEEDEKSDCYSLPAPPRRRTRAVTTQVKEYSSENEAHKKSKKRLMKKNSHIHRWVMQELNKRDDDVHGNGSGGQNEEGNSSSSGVLVATRPKGGRRSLYMGLEEVKACRDLGFELEEQYHHISFNSNADLNAPCSGASSPIPTWRISSPGDDPRDVKARLKVWAQAVAIASSSTCSSPSSSHHGT